MLTLRPQYITDSTGAKLVILTIDEFNSIIEELEDIEDIRLYDEAKGENGSERILLSDYLKQRKANSK